MLAVRMTTRLPVTALVGCVRRSPVYLKGPNVVRVHQYSQNTGSRFAKRATVKDAVASPSITGQGAISGGRGFLAAASGVGLGALCYYGLGMANEPGVIENSRLWPEFVKERVRSTYMYFASGIGITAATAVAASKNQALMRLMTKNSLLAIGATFAVMIGTNIFAQSIPYKKGFGAKQLAFMAHAAVLGAVVAPITFLGGAILMRAAWMTAGVVGGLSTVAMCAPSEKFLNMGGPLACGFGLVLASSIAGAFVNPGTALGAGLYSVSMYGGLVLFSLFLLYDTQKIMKRAETHPQYGVMPYDPVNASLGIYSDTLNIFIRIAMMLAGQRKK